MYLILKMTAKKQHKCVFFFTVLCYSFVIVKTCIIWIIYLTCYQFPTLPQIIHQNVFTHFFFLTSLQLFTFSPFKGLFVVLLLHTKKIQFSSAVIQNCSCSISDSISLLRYNIKKEKKKKNDSCMIQRISDRDFCSCVLRRSFCNANSIQQCILGKIKTHFCCWGLVWCCLLKFLQNKDKKTKKLNIYRLKHKQNLHFYSKKLGLKVSFRCSVYTFHLLNIIFFKEMPSTTPRRSIVYFKSFIITTWCGAF